MCTLFFLHLALLPVEHRTKKITGTMKQSDEYADYFSSLFSSRQIDTQTHALKLTNRHKTKRKELKIE